MVWTDHTRINVEDLHHHDNIRFNNITMLSCTYLKNWHVKEKEWIIQFLPKLEAYLRAFGNFRHEEDSTGWAAIEFLQFIAKMYRGNGEVWAFIESIE